MPSLLIRHHVEVQPGPNSWYWTGLRNRCRSTPSVRDRAMMRCRSGRTW